MISPRPGYGISIRAAKWKYPSCRRAETGLFGSQNRLSGQLHHKKQTTLSASLPPAFPEADGGMEILSQARARAKPE